MYRVRLLLLALAALPLAACGDSTRDDAADGRGITIDARGQPPAPARRAEARLGPVRYSFDTSRLTLAEVMLALPPVYEELSWAVKLIPDHRAVMLGSIACDYDGSDGLEMCNSQDEAGLAMALLDRPMADYRSAFEAAGAGDMELSNTTLDGVSGFAFTAAPEDGGRLYRFVPVAGRTFVVARRPGSIADGDREAIDEVIAALDLGR